MPMYATPIPRSHASRNYRAAAFIEIRLWELNDDLLSGRIPVDNAAAKINGTRRLAESSNTGYIFS